MTDDELDSLVHSHVRAASGKVNVGWLYFQIGAAYPPDRVYDTPTSVDVQRSCHRLVAAGRVARDERHRLSAVRAGDDFSQFLDGASAQVSLWRDGRPLEVGTLRQEQL